MNYDSKIKKLKIDNENNAISELFFENDEISENFDFADFENFLSIPDKQCKCIRCSEPAEIQMDLPDLAIFYYCKLHCKEAILEFTAYDDEEPMDVDPDTVPFMKVFKKQ